ncbi:E3 ubiquitin-protein ligase Rnf220-like [Strongylocentrotus purpuratus]|uniref:RING-type domain-containing protein n=1 Tax=Strongylocentrotus purpuratus TaxID=7668 RepID=A0A7M7PN04_STRPU|nr:E3 ubiquitin-protein ligase Rnf220-like [Strongylocentrotus purpuratus]
MAENPKRRSLRQVINQSIGSSVKESLSEEVQDEKSSVAEVPPTSTNNTASKSSRSSGRRRLLEGNQICPVCGITVRPSEVEQHFRSEVQQIDNIVRRGRVQKDAAASYTLSKEQEREDGNGRKRIIKRKRRRTRNESDSETSSSSDSDSESSVEVDPQLVLLDVRANRHARERKKQLHEIPECNPDTMLCPVCFVPLIGSEVDRNRHVENCLTGCPSTAPATNGAAEDAVDVDGEGLGEYAGGGGGSGVVEEGEAAGDDSYDTYEWMGETRLRTVSLVPGGYQGLGYQITSSRKSQDANDEDDIDLDVDGDETEQFGPQQYAEEDVIARCPSRSSQDTGDVGYEDHVNDNLLIEACLGVQCNGESGMETETKHSVKKHVGLPSAGIQIVVESLKARVKELEEESGNGRGRLKCQICMGAYNTPLVSIQCWHVHCEDCWLKTLASKKLCPQCQLITAPSQLRKLYL